MDIKVVFYIIGVISLINATNYTNIDPYDMMKWHKIDV
jgi:hypothetical protein